MAGDHEAVTAIVASATEHKHTWRVGARSKFPRRHGSPQSLGRATAGILHQDYSWNPELLDRHAIEEPNLFTGEDPGVGAAQLAARAGAGS